MKSTYRRPRISLTASAIPAVPPASWYENPNLTAPTAITVTDDGKIFGHLAPWGTCHTGFRDSCVTAPKSTTDYAYFTIGSTAVECDDCDGNKVSEIRTGVITLGTLHAGQKLNGKAALSHYENTGAAVADVAAGEDTHGIWIAGALRPTVTEKEVRELRGAALSGDWRRINGNLELVAALAVNTPGFPVIRASAFVAEDGEQMSLVAAGALMAKPEEKVDKPISAFDELKQTLAYGYDKPKKKKKEMASEDLVNKIALAFSPEQERDESGKWTSGGSDDRHPETIEPYADLSGRDFHNKDLDGADLHGANLSETNLRGAHLKDAVLTDANLSNANLRFADLTNADLTGADLTNADWRGAMLEGAILQGATFDDGSIGSPRLPSTDILKGTLGTPSNFDMSLVDKITLAYNPDQERDENGRWGSGGGDNPPKAYGWSDPSEIKNGADLRDKTFLAMDLRDGGFIETDLRNADLGGTSLQGVNFYGTDLRGANLDGAQIEGANFLNAKLEGASMRDLDLKMAKFETSSLRDADLSGSYNFGLAYYDKASTKGADLSEVFEGAKGGQTVPEAIAENDKP